MYHFLLACLAQLFAVLLGTAPLLVLMGYRTLRPYVEGSSLTQDLLRPPGYSLRERLDRHQEDGLAILLTVLFVAVLYSSIVTVETATRQFGLPWFGLSLVGVLSVPIGIWLFRKLDRYILMGRELTAGLRGEMATGEELNTLMLDGYRVFHDVPIDHGNVDHVVVGPGGLYAVETKHIRRWIDSEDAARLTVDFDRKVIDLPRGAIPIPEEQLEMQRRELSSLLSAAVGERVEAESMLAIPGWYIARRGKPTFVAFNPKNPRGWFRGRPARLSQQTIQRVAYQLEKLCRDVPAKKVSPKPFAKA